MSNTCLEMTIRIDADAHPRLHAYLSGREQGKRRAAALKRLAEEALLLAGNAAPAASSVVNINRRPMDSMAERLPGVAASDVRSSLTQFLPERKP